MKEITVASVLLAIVAASLSGFTKEKVSTNFYRFTGNQNSVSQVMNYAYYISSPNPCDDIDGNLCGIFLDSFQGYGQHANSGEIQPYLNSLFYSVLYQFAMDPRIRMRF